MKHLIAIAATALCVVLPACSTCEGIEDHGATKCKGAAGERITLTWKPERALEELASQENVKITLSRVIHDYRKRKITATLRIHNRLDNRMWFDLERTRLSYLGEDYSADSGLFSDRHPDITAKNSKRFTFVFDIPGEAEVEGDLYPVSISGIEVEVDGVRQPLGNGISFELPVPGEK